MEVDRGLEVLAIAEPVGALLDRLDLGVEPLTHRIGDPMPEVGQDVGQVPLEQARHLDARREPRVRRPEIPAGPVPLGPAPATVAPEVTQGLLDRLGACRLEIQRLLAQEPLGFASTLG